ncbi:hypothetical protein FGIG_01869 [Fasciola gigantica]|uniref:Uncharacterized protein n=1 Tax=Fasciola gigantica TaxID=46835 RepID=A0A504YK09_FASGI|nr:hypothetical protein FGIG_01869 [Fasciola gigantica]
MVVAVLAANLDGVNPASTFSFEADVVLLRKNVRVVFGLLVDSHHVDSGQPLGFEIIGGWPLNLVDGHIKRIDLAFTSSVGKKREQITLPLVDS